MYMSRYLISFACISILSIICVCNAKDLSYNFEKKDEIGDVEDIVKGNYLCYPNVDIASAAVKENDSDLIFSLRVDGNIVKGNSSIWYLFRITSANTTVEVIYSNNFSYVYNFKAGMVIGTCEFSIEDGNLEISVPKSYLQNLALPWNVTAYAEVYGKYKDIVILEPYQKKSKKTPGFELTILISALSTVYLATRLRRW